MSPAPSAPLRIVHIGSTLYRGGVSTATANLCKGQVRLGHRVWLVCNGGEAAAMAQGEGVTVRAVPFAGGRVRALLRSVPAVRAVLRDAQPDVVHVHGRASSLLALMAGRYPDWFTLHSTHLTEQVGPLDRGWMRRHLSPLGHDVFVLNDRAEAYCTKALRVAAHRIHRLPNGVDCEYFRPPSAHERMGARAAFGVDEGAILVVYVGRFRAEKQPEAVVALAREAKRAGLSHVRVLLVGEGPMEQALRGTIAREGLEDVCQLRTWMSSRTVYHAADLVVMPSRFEGFGLVGAEAIASGCALLRSRTGGFGTMVQEGVSGFGCAPSADDFVRVASELLASPHRLQTVRAQAPAHARVHLSLVRQATVAVDAYRAKLRRGEDSSSLGVVRCS